MLTVTSGTCTFNFGSIDLGSGSYVSSAAVFGGSNANVSTIAWNASTHTLTITLGAKKSGTAAAVASSTPAYTASGSLVNTSGTASAYSPFTLASGRQARVVGRGFGVQIEHRPLGCRLQRSASAIGDARTTTATPTTSTTTGTTIHAVGHNNA